MKTRTILPEFILIPFFLYRLLHVKQSSLKKFINSFLTTNTISSEKFYYIIYKNSCHIKDFPLKITKKTTNYHNIKITLIHIIISITFYRILVNHRYGYVCTRLSTILEYQFNTSVSVTKKKNLKLE